MTSRPRCPWPVLVLVLLGGPWLAAGCTDPAPLCPEGQSRCGDTCVDLSSSSAQCGACGQACAGTEACVAGTCQCRPGATRCGEACVVTASDPDHCGGCAGEGGEACAAQAVCEAGECKTACTRAGATVCGRACVDLQTDAFHCGACGGGCADARGCHAGACADDVIAACFNTGQVVGLPASADARGPSVAVGTSPQALGVMQDVLLVLDASTVLRQARLSDYGELPARTATGLVPNQVRVREPYVFILNSTSNTLQVLRRDGAPVPGPGPRFPQGLALTNVGSVNLGANTNPYAFTLVGPDAYVTLLGNLQSDASAGGRVVRVSLADPTAPRVTGSFPLPSGEALEPFAGRVPLPAPAGITVLGGRVFAALGNLDARDYASAGPGFLAVLDPTSGSVERLALGPDCLNAFWVEPVGERLLVSCGGSATYDRDFNLTDVRGTGLVLLDAGGRVLASLPLRCPEGTSCPLPSAGRFAVVGSRAYVGDNNAGRLFVLDVVGDTLVARPELLVCPRAQGPSLVSDVLAVP